MSDKNNISFKDFFSEEDFVNVKSYDFVKAGYAFLFAGAFIVFLSYAGYLNNRYLIGIAFFIVGILLVFKKLSSLFSFDDDFPEDEKSFEGLFSEFVYENIVPYSKNLLNIKDDIGEDNVFVFCVPVFESCCGKTPEDIKRKITGEGFYVYSMWNINVLYAGDKFLSFFSCYFDILEKSYENSVTDEFYYSDISSVKLEYSEESFNYVNSEDEKTERVKKLVISNISGDKIVFTAERPELNTFPGLSDDCDEFVKNIRLKIRKVRFPDNMPDDKDIDFEIEDTRGEL